MKTRFAVIIVLSFISQVAVSQIDMVIPIGHTRRVADVQLSTDGQCLASIDGSDRVTIWNYQTGKETYHFTTKHPVTLISYGTKSLVVADKSGAIQKLSSTGEVEQTITTDSDLVGLYASGNDSLLVITEKELSWYFKGKKITNTKTKLEAIAVATPTVDLITVGSKDGQVEVFDANLTSIHQIMVTEASVASIDYTPQSILIGTTSGELIQLNK